MPSSIRQRAADIADFTNLPQDLIGHIHAQRWTGADNGRLSNGRKRKCDSNFSKNAQGLARWGG